MQDNDGYARDEVRRTFERIALDTLKNGGGTYQHKTGAKVDLTREYGSGYVVGVAYYGTVPAAPEGTINLLGDYLPRVWPREIAPNVQYVGTWIHMGQVWVDGVVVLPESARDLAQALGRKHQQASIYNIRTGKSEPVDYDYIDQNLAALETVDLIAELHEHIFGDVERSIVDEDGECDDWAKWAIERLRVLLDDEYRECAYGADDDYDDYDDYDD